MQFPSLPVLATLSILSGVTLAQSSAEAAHLNLTTIALVNGTSVFQCWQLNETLLSTQNSNGGGTLKNSSLGPLGDPVNATWLSVPANTSNPEHAAAAVEYNVVLSGTLVLGVSLTGQTAMIEGGTHGLILVTDTSGTGHSARITEEAPAVVLMLPIKDDVVPGHTVLYEGQCAEEEMGF